MTAWKTIEPQKRRYLWAWVIFIIAVYVAIGITALSVVEGEKVQSNRSHELRMTPGKVEPGLTPPDPVPETDKFVPVTVGLYLDDIENFSIKDSFWTTTFYIWFRWSGDRALDPGKNFQLIDAKVEKKELLEEYSGPDGTNYQRYRVSAKVAKVFNTTRVPLDDHMLNIVVEDGSRDASKLRYVVDPDSNISSRVKVPGYVITGFGQVAKYHTYRSQYGDPRAAKGGHKTVSAFTVGISVKRASMGIYLKVFIGLFAGMLLTFASFSLRASEGGPRVSLPVGSYFGAVANSYLAASMLPSSGQFGLVEHVSFLGLFTIFTCLLASVVSMYVWQIVGDKDFSRAFDKATAITIGLAYVIINIALPISAFTGL